MSELEVLNVSGIDCYEKDGTVYLKLEAVARGLGFTETAASGNECVRWRTVRKYLADLGVATSCDGDKLPDFIPENIFYRLAMKAKNEVAEAFQAKVADEVIPSIRKHGAYMTEDTLDRIINSPEFGIKLLTALKEEKDKRKALELANSELTVQNAIMAPKAECFDELMDRGGLTSLRDSAKLLHIKQNDFIRYLLDHKYLYRDQGSKLRPYQKHVDDGLFELKVRYNQKTQWSGPQPMITVKGLETFRLLCLDAGTKN